MAAEKKTNETEKPEAAGGAVKADKFRGRKKVRKTGPFAVFHIYCTFNNTIITVSDDRGETLAWSTSGACGFRGTKKGTPFAAQVTSSKVAHKVAEMGVKEATVLVSGPGPGRETAIRAVQASGLHVVSIKDVTPIPHNGCRPPKARRV